MHYIAWIAKHLNDNVNLLEVNERFYENKKLGSCTSAKHTSAVQEELCKVQSCSIATLTVPEDHFVGGDMATNQVLYKPSQCFLHYLRSLRHDISVANKVPFPILIITFHTFVAI